MSGACRAPDPSHYKWAPRSGQPLPNSPTALYGSVQMTLWTWTGRLGSWRLSAEPSGMQPREGRRRAGKSLGLVGRKRVRGLQRPGVGLAARDSSRVGVVMDVGEDVVVDVVVKVGEDVVVGVVVGGVGVVVGVVLGGVGVDESSVGA